MQAMIDCPTLLFFANAAQVGKGKSKKLRLRVGVRMICTRNKLYFFC